MSFLRWAFAARPIRVRSSVLVLDQVLRRLEVLGDHLGDERVERDLALPAQEPLRLCGVTEEQAVEGKREEGEGR